MELDRRNWWKQPRGSHERLPRWPLFVHDDRRPHLGPAPVRGPQAVSVPSDGIPGSPPQALARQTVAGVLLEWVETERNLRNQLSAAGREVANLEQWRARSGVEP